MLSYAQNYEDVVLERALGGKSEGFYVDVGAASPREASVTRHFYESGWHGINVEPVAAWAAELRSLRPRDVTLEVAAGVTEGEVTLYEVTDDFALSTVRPEVATRHRIEGHHVRETTVACRSLNSILEEESPGSIDFLKIDVEGGEAEVLSGLDLRRWRPRVILIESTEPNSLVSTHERFEAGLLAAGYLYVSCDGINRYYLREEDRALAPLLVPANSTDSFTPLRERLLEDEIERLRLYVHRLERAVEDSAAAIDEERRRADQLITANRPHRLRGAQTPPPIVPRIDLDRLVVLSSPMTGASHLAAALAEVLAAPLFVADHPADVSLADLPDRAVLELCWPRSEALRARLLAHGFRAATICRHPLDTLVSLLLVAQRDRGTGRWLDDDKDPEATLRGVGPLSEAFATWATSARAAALLGVSATWAEDPGTLRVAHGPFVADPVSALTDLLDSLGIAPRGVDADEVADGRSPAESGHAVEEFVPSPADLEVVEGVWRDLLPAGRAEAIISAHLPLFTALGFSPTVDAADLPGEHEAEAAWRRLAR